MATEIRSTRSATLAATDVALIAELEDPALIEGIADDWLLTDDPAAIRRVGVDAEARLDRLARVEFRKNGGMATGPALRAKAAVSGRLSDWRKHQEAKSPAARRDAIIRKYRSQIADRRTQTERSALAFKLTLGPTSAYADALARAREARERGDGLVFGSAFEKHR